MSDETKKILIIVFITRKKVNNIGNYKNEQREN